MSAVCETCGLPKEICVCEEIAREQQRIQIYTAQRRYGKTVTIVDGMNSSDIDMDSLTKDLKSACACGGTHKEGRVELQGDHRRRAKEVLEKMGFNTEVK
ncbi:MAG TPA: stress response translation initiation inhibitor YciH [Candidatus Thermoplasmatota archaeon]|jgi:translation initiation factor 1|nr:stress response translation initiation inhibitor YciH [Candidatus Thermoplasmatota archaeon]